MTRRTTRKWTLYPSNYGGDAIAAEGEERLIAVGPDVRRFTETVDADAYRRAVSLLTDGRAFWDAVYPYITEDGPDLNLADCEKITSWLAAHLAGSPDVQR